MVYVNGFRIYVLYIHCTRIVKQNAEEEVGKLKQQLGRINELADKLAVRYCEDQKTFRLEDVLNTFHSFCQLIQQCRKVRHCHDHMIDAQATCLK